MILADTSVWIDHFRHGSIGLAELLESGRALMHPFVIGELACGNLQDRAKILSGLRVLPSATAATHDEVLVFIDRHRLWGAGLGWIDLHLLASSLLTGCRFWTLDKRLAQAAVKLSRPSVI